MKLIQAADYDRMSRIAANHIAAQLICKPDSLLGLATGSTPLGAYQALIEKNRAGDVDFSLAHTVNLDEYAGMSRSHEQSYYRYMHSNFFRHINIDPANTRLPDGMAADLAAECAAYDAAIAARGGVDLQLLGLGHDGHIGFNEPAEAFSTGTHCVALTPMTIEANRRFFASADEVPKKALTMGMREIMQAKTIVMVVSGADKAEILYQVFFGPVTPAVPGSILQLQPHVTLIADPAALSVTAAKKPCALR